MLTIFMCGRTLPSYPAVTVLATHVELWTALGWVPACDVPRGKVLLEWRSGGEPQRPQRLGAGGGR